MTRREREAASMVLKAMAHPVRLGTIELLAAGEMTVTELYSALGCSQSADRRSWADMQRFFDEIFGL